MWSGETVQIWPLTGDAPVSIDEAGPPFALAWNPVRDQLVVCSEKTLSICGLDGEVIFQEDFRDPVKCVGYSADGTKFAVAGDGFVRCFDSDGNMLIDFEIPSGYRAPRRLAWSHDGQRIAIGAFVGKVWLWASDGRFIQRLDFGQWHPTVAWHPSRRLLAVTGHHKSIGLFDEDARQVATFDSTGQDLFGLGWHPNGSRLAAAGAYGLLEIWTVDGKLDNLLPDVSSYRGVSWTSGGEFLAARPSMGHVRLFDKGGRVFGTSTGKEDSQKLGLLRWTGDDDTLIVVPAATSKFQVFAVPSESWRTQPLRAAIYESNDVDAVDFALESQELVYGADDGFVNIAKVGGRDRQFVQCALKPVTHVATTPSGNPILTVSGGQDGSPTRVEVWNSGAEKVAEFDEQNVLYVKSSPDGKLIAFSGPEVGVRVRRLDGSLVWQDSRAKGEVAWTADGTKLAALSSRYSGHSVWVWGSSGNEIGQYDYRQRVWTVDWSPDGRTLTTGHERVVEVRNVSDNTVQWKAITPNEELPPVVIRKD